METNFKEQLHDTRPYWKVIVSLTFSLIATILFIYVGFRLLGFVVRAAPGQQRAHRHGQAAGGRSKLLLHARSFQTARCQSLALDDA